jgi:hypothetical protein
MIHANDTHVLIDEQGVAVLSGSEAEMREYADEMLRLGHTQHCIRTIDEHAYWDWSFVDWGD